MNYVSNALSSVQTAMGQNYYIDQQLLKLQWYHEFFKNRGTLNKHINHLLKSYEDTIGYRSHCIFIVNGSMKLCNLIEENGKVYLYLVLSGIGDTDKIEVSETQIFRGYWKPVNEDLYPEPLRDDQITPITAAYVSIPILAKWYSAWAKLEYIKIQLEAIIETENLSYQFHTHIRKKRKLSPRRRSSNKIPRA